MIFHTVLQVSESSPRIIVRVRRYTPTSTETGATGLYLSRAGTAGEFAFYEPLQILGEHYTFQFDDLLFTRDEGRYLGRIVIQGVDCGVVQLQLRKETKIIAGESIQASTCEDC